MTEPLRYQFLPNVAPDEADVVVLPVPFEATVSGRGGTARGPAAILAASEQIEYHDELADWSPMMHLEVSVQPSLEAGHGTDAEDFQACLEETARGLSRPPSLLIALGGEHSITPGLVAGAMPEPGTVVQLDAHADLRRHFEGSAHSHACPMHHLRERGHTIVMAGVRSFLDAERRRIAEDPGLELFDDWSLRSEAGRAALIERCAAIAGPTWLTIDLDVFDPGLVPGVGTPQPGGLDWYTVVEVVEAVAGNRHADLRGVDIVELIPDASSVSDTVAAKLMQKIISFWGRSRGLHERPMNGGQSRVAYE
jgi:agmatinase